MLCLSGHRQRCRLVAAKRGRCPTSPTGRLVLPLVGQILARSDNTKLRLLTGRYRLICRLGSNRKCCLHRQRCSVGIHRGGTICNLAAILIAVMLLLSGHCQRCRLVAAEGSRCPTSPTGRLVLPLIGQILAGSSNTKLRLLTGRYRLICRLGSNRKCRHLIVRCRHGVGVIERGCTIVFVPIMISEAGRRKEEPIVLSLALIPGSIEIVILVAQFSYIPRVRACGVSNDTITGNDASIHVQSQSQTIEEVRVTLANCSLIHQRSIGRMLEMVAVVVQVIVVVSNVLCNILIDTAEFLVIGAIIQIQLIKKLGYFNVQRCFLTGCCVITNGIGSFHFRHISGICTSVRLMSTIRELQVIAFHRITGMRYRSIKNLMKGLIDVCVGSRVVDLHGCFAVYHCLTKLLNRLTFRNIGNNTVCFDRGR